jgi:hypothetical protein
MKKEDCINLKFAANVSVTYKYFYNEAHQDKKEWNGWAYGIFTYIDKSTGNPISCPSSKLVHGFLFTRHAYLIEFVKSNGIVELVWQTTNFENCTTPPPPSLSSQNNPEHSWTHQGCPFQINKNLASVAKRSKNATPEEIQEKTLCKSQKYPS